MLSNREIQDCQQATGAENTLERQGRARQHDQRDQGDYGDDSGCKAAADQQGQQRRPVSAF